MSNKEFSEKLKAGIELAGKRMLEEKALRGEDVIVSADGKTIERIPATQLLRESTWCFLRKKRCYVADKSLICGPQVLDLSAINLGFIRYTT